MATEAKRAAWRQRIAIGLIIIGVANLNGCLIIPATGLFQPDGRRAPDGKIGTDKRDPVQLGRTRIEDALIVLVQQVRPPSPTTRYTTVDEVTMPLNTNAWTMSADGRRFGVSYSVRKSTAVWPLCFTANTEVDGRRLELETDANGIVVASKVVKAGRSMPSFYPLADTPTVSPEWPDEYGAIQLDLVDRVFSPAARQKLIESGLMFRDEDRPAVRKGLARRAAATQAIEAARKQRSGVQR